MTGSATHRAIFIDRDGTLVHARHYPSRPEELVLYDGIGPKLRLLQDAGFKLIVITNQSGIARGYFTPADLAVMHAHVSDELRAHGVQIDGYYFCPHHPEGVIAELAISCDCRKPEPGMIVRASQDHGIDPTRSWFLGDILDDIEAGNRAGCRPILIDLGTESLPPSAQRTPEFVARDTAHALDIILAEEGLGELADRQYRPEGWSTVVAEGVHAIAR